MSNAEGLIKIEKLPLGNYYLKEKKAPNNYNLDETEISQEELDNISSIIGKNEIGENDSEVFDIINQVSIFIRTTSNMNLRNYINHPRNYFTKNIVTLSLDNEL